ncbi:potassium-transporting ATPase subunit KdpA, partial [Caballeronia terrestris]|uniref:potassium-transporting ATPase subunit KdpA n=1 Tax=Caballeronia terrestris TaxID=1226301 RepID=UPI000A8AFE45
MNANNLFQTGLFIVVLIALAIPLGRYITGVMDGSSVVVRRIGRPIEAVLYKLAGVDPDVEMSWKHYALAVLAFSAVGTLALYAL